MLSSPQKAVSGFNDTTNIVLHVDEQSGTLDTATVFTLIKSFDRESSAFRNLLKQKFRSISRKNALTYPK